MNLSDAVNHRNFICSSCVQLHLYSMGLSTSGMDGVNIHLLKNNIQRYVIILLIWILDRYIIERRPKMRLLI